MTQNEQLIYAVLLGFTVDYTGEVFLNEVVVKPKVNSEGRFRVFVRGQGNGFLQFCVHRLQALQKFGDSLFESGIVVRHLNGNPLDNSWDNIAIGSQQENMLDRAPEDRVEHSLRAARVTRKLSWEEMEQLRKDRESGDTYKTLCSRYGIAKSTVSYIINHKTYNIA